MAINKVIYGDNVLVDLTPTTAEAEDVIEGKTFVNRSGVLTTGTSTGGSTGGSSDYEELDNKPSINNVTLTGNKTTSDLGIDIPTATSDLTNDSGFITSYTETDPVFLASAAHGISSSDITNWNNKLDTSKVKTTMSTTSGDVYDVTVLNDFNSFVSSSLSDLLALINAKLDTSKVKTTFSTTRNDVYDVNYINDYISGILIDIDDSINAKANASDIVVYTAGTGISIQNGVISLSLTSAESEEF